MLCPQCYGKHVVLQSGSWLPCSECAGVGELHCCDGLREQEECRYTSPTPHLTSTRVPSPAEPVAVPPSPSHTPAFA